MPDFTFCSCKTAKRAARNALNNQFDIMTVTFRTTSADDIKICREFPRLKTANARAKNVSAKVMRLTCNRWPIARRRTIRHQSQNRPARPPQPASDAAKGTNVYVVCDRRTSGHSGFAQDISDNIFPAPVHSARRRYATCGATLSWSIVEALACLTTHAPAKCRHP